MDTQPLAKSYSSPLASEQAPHVTAYLLDPEKYTSQSQVVVSLPQLPIRKSDQPQISSPRSGTPSFLPSSLFLQ